MNCPYCNKPVEFLSDSSEIYHGKNYGPVYICRPCQAWVGCHKGTDKPLGRLADKELRNLKIALHDEFDSIWKSGMMKRKDAYQWLAGELGITVDDCHIGMFDNEMCRKALKKVIIYTTLNSEET